MTPKKLQANTHVEKRCARKYEVGRALRFIGYSKDEAFSVADRDPKDLFSLGDVVRPVARNACGMGIDVIREKDGIVDMVWPEEVRIVGRKKLKRSTRLGPHHVRRGSR